MSDGDDRFVGFREFAALRERMTKLEASLDHIPGEVRALRESVEKATAAMEGAARQAAQAPMQQDHTALAIQRVLDATRPNRFDPLQLVLLAMSMLGAAAVGAKLGIFN